MTCHDCHDCHDTGIQNDGDWCLTCAAAAFEEATRAEAELELEEVIASAFGTPRTRAV